ncbi:hypothetical protein RclHR1_04050006 [Rhizophagus clarus]|uniref:P-loop containing nucleoside triphosphate hydrolase protein n=1 Tax=Rhizophagus clarus TaxID=94130 RepID=A0A2Z6RIX5_9GLOM|nr:hypothetical protein RclHR1_04050006 [Rhizophagus clarus]GES76020.1 P-loop containing nucleoside triphosphate hydrolase protein [Rhizophagus clarus]
MAERRGKRSGSNNDGIPRSSSSNGNSSRNTRSRGRRGGDGDRNSGGGRGGGSHRGGDGDGDGRRDGRFDIIDQSRNHTPTPPRLSVPEIRQSQHETTITNFNSSELTYNGSDRLVFITNGEQIKTIWKRILKKDKPWNQSDARIFVSSALVASDHRTGYEVEEIVTELGNPECGLKRLRELINFPSMSCDAGLDSNVLSFQHVILPLLGLFTRTAITECILEKYVHAIFMVVYINLDSFLYGNVMKMLEILVQRHSVVDNRVSAEMLLTRERFSYIPSSLGVFFLIIVRLLTELLRRVKEASINETIHNIANDLYRLKTAYHQSLERQQFSSTDLLTNNVESRKYFFTILEREMKNMDKMLNNGRTGFILEQNLRTKNLNVKFDRSYYKELARKVDAERTYDPPGELSKYGKRHDNDFVEISQISIIPTNDEILCERPPFLPSFRYSLHFLPDGAARLLDTQFRLLREDLLNPIRNGLSNLMTALLQEYTPSNSDAKLSKELKKVQERGGRFSYSDGINENGDLQVYTNVQFANISCDRRKGFACTIRFTPPRSSAKNEKGRKEYWEKSKKLLTGSLVTIILPNPNPKRVNSYTTTNVSDLYSLYFGVVVSRDEKALSKDENFSEIDINFIDPLIYPIALSEISNFKKNSSEKRFMVESTGVYLEAYIHILKTLQTTNPSFLPFEKYLAPNFEDKGVMGHGFDVKVENPMYTRAPGFLFDLSILCKYKYELTLNVADESSYDRTIRNIVNYSDIGKLPNGASYGLDETQTKALISSLTREIALVEGPPGTGKTVVGIQIMKVLLAKENRHTNIGPILTICFTNHALDQFLEHLLDENIINIVRLGSRSKSDKIKEFSLEEVCRNRARTKKESYLLAKLYDAIEKIEKDVKKFKNTLFNRWMKWSDIREYLITEEREFFDKFDIVPEYDLPSWVLGTDDDEGFQTSRRNNRQKKKDPFDEWIEGNDIRIINKRKELLLNPPKNEKKNKKNPNQNTYEILLRGGGTEEYMDISDDETQIDYYTINWIRNYKEPKTDRPLDVLLYDYSVWNMSMVERQKLHDHWRTKIYKEIVEKLSELQNKHEEIRKEINEIYDEGRRQVLLNSDVIGMTTNGAAKFQNLIRSIGPKIIVCEEAGEVLEAHILSALTPSTQHLILIGDHNQLRPHIATYSLSMDSPVGDNYQLDKSLFERLVKGDKAVKIEKAQLLTQRRMRGEVSDLIRYTLYPNLIDGDNTFKYENIRGAQHNVYFIEHRNPEDNSGGEFAVKSHVNRYEVRMVVEMVKYFVRNGYTKKDDIAVLTPYLGQMIKIRDALRKSFVVVIDERDAQDIAEMEEQQEEQGEANTSNVETISVASRKSLNQQVTLRTVDNFQGEEANIVIVSLVRNFSSTGSAGGSIGFLKSTNRTNVLLSRARKGMYLIGNSELMAMKSKDMWAPVIKILRKRNQVGFGMPIVCNKHPHYKNTIIDPDQFEQVSPDGGCYEKCNMSLPCGHICKYKCHSDDPEHIGVKCIERCLRLHPECNHPCQRRCSDDCGRCEFPIGHILLPGCYHKLQNAKCWQNRNKDSIKCKTLVSKKLSRCEHYKDILCSESVDNVKCTELCGKLLECGHECLNSCSECQERSNSQKSKDKNKTNIFVPIERTKHGKCKNVCDRLLFCGHICKTNCHEGKECPPCKNNCTVTCMHTSCHKRCLEPCAVCAEKCLWECKHQGRCELSCGAPCYRVPCNERCNKVLECGHNCAGVCGEVCPSKDFCVECAPENVKSQVPDMIINSTFSEVDWEVERMIVLTCGHVYTMETMDMLMEMKDYYEGSVEGGWTSVKMLPTSPMNMKTCPTCRTPIKHIRRYGRIINKYTLDVQNKKFLSKYDRQLKEIAKQIIPLRDEMTNRRNELKDTLPKVEFRPTEVVFKEHNVINEKLPEITPFNYFEKIETYHGFDKISEKAWIAHVKKLLNCYQRLISIINATKLPPHKKAFEAAVSSLYQAKLAQSDPENDLVEKLLNFQISDNSSSFDDYVSNMNTIRSTPAETFQETLSQVGVSIPQVDRRIYLDTFFEIINIQKILHHEILFIIQELSKELTPTTMLVENVISIREVWRNFIGRLQRSIQGHLNTIREIAESTHYGRHLLLVDIEILEFDLILLRYQLRFPTNRNGIIDKPLQNRITRGCNDIKSRIMSIANNYRRKNFEMEFKKDIHQRLTSLLESCKEVEACAVNLNRTLSVEEKLEIHRAMKTEFRGAGHWYECPNGHPYTIGECGGAMQMSRCPDCNAQIGGGHHELTSGNRLNSEFDSM